MTYLLCIDDIIQPLPLDRDSDKFSDSYPLVAQPDRSAGAALIL
jgi:hypothetical protein